MSCGRPHDMPCSEVLALVYRYLDGELGSSGYGEVRKHLDECGPCLREYDLEGHLKALVRRSCQECAPADLRVRILMQITQVRVQMEG